VAWAAASASFCSTRFAHKSKLRGSVVSKTGGLEDPRGLDYNGGISTLYRATGGDCTVSTEVQGDGAAGVRYPIMHASW